MILSPFQKEIVDKIINRKITDMDSFISYYLLNDSITTENRTRPHCEELQVIISLSDEEIINKVSDFLFLWDNLDKAGLIKTIEDKKFGYGYLRVTAFCGEGVVLSNKVSSLLSEQNYKAIFPFEEALKRFKQRKYYTDDEYLTEPEFNKSKTLQYQNIQVWITAILAILTIGVTLYGIRSNRKLTENAILKNTEFQINSQRPFLKISTISEMTETSYLTRKPYGFNLAYYITNVGNNPSINSIIRISIDTNSNFPTNYSQFTIIDTIHNIIYPDEEYTHTTIIDSSTTLLLDNFQNNQYRDSTENPYSIYSHIYFEYVDPLQNVFYYGSTFKTVGRAPSYDPETHLKKNTFDRYNLFLLFSYDNIMISTN